MVSNQVQNRPSIDFLDEKKKNPNQKNYLIRNSGFLWDHSRQRGSRFPGDTSEVGHSNLRLKGSHSVSPKSNSALEMVLSDFAEHEWNLGLESICTFHTGNQGTWFYSGAKTVLEGLPIELHVCKWKFVCHVKCF